MHEREYLTYDGLGLAKLVADKQITAAELLTIAQARADRVNPRINAIVNRLDDRAKEQLRQDLSGPYAGVPFLLKDLGQDLAGTPTSSGCRALADVDVTAKAPSCSAGSTRAWSSSARPTLPSSAPRASPSRTLRARAQPVGHPRTPGGSSGGAAAAVAAGIVPVAARERRRRLDPHPRRLLRPRRAQSPGAA